MIGELPLFCFNESQHFSLSRSPLCFLFFSPIFCPISLYPMWFYFFISILLSLFSRWPQCYSEKRLAVKNFWGCIQYVTCVSGNVYTHSETGFFYSRSGTVFHMGRIRCFFKPGVLSPWGNLGFRKWGVGRGRYDQLGSQIDRLKLFEYWSFYSADQCLNSSNSVSLWSYYPSRSSKLAHPPSLIGWEPLR